MRVSQNCPNRTKQGQGHNFWEHMHKLYKMFGYIFNRRAAFHMPIASKIEHLFCCICSFLTSIPDSSNYKETLFWLRNYPRSAG